MSSEIIQSRAFNIENKKILEKLVPIQSQVEERFGLNILVLEQGIRVVLSYREDIVLQFYLYEKITRYLLKSIYKSVDGTSNFKKSVK